MATKKGFLLLNNQIEIIETLTDEQAGQLLKAFYDYNIGYGLKPIDELQVMDTIIPCKEIIDYIIDVYYVSTHKFDYSDLPLWTVIRNKYKIKDKITINILKSEITDCLNCIKRSYHK